MKIKSVLSDERKRVPFAMFVNMCIIITTDVTPYL